MVIKNITNENPIIREIVGNCKSKDLVFRKNLEAVVAIYPLKVKLTQLATKNHKTLVKYLRHENRNRKKYTHQPNP